MANEIARKLRKTMTPQEVKLWVHLRSWRRRGFHFRRQSPRDGFIVNFVCLKQKLVVEVDGASTISMITPREIERATGISYAMGFACCDFGTATWIRI